MHHSQPHAIKPEDVGEPGVRKTQARGGKVRLVFSLWREEPGCDRKRDDDGGTDDDAVATQGRVVSDAAAGRRSGGSTR